MLGASSFSVERCYRLYGRFLREEFELNISCASNESFVR